MERTMICGVDEAGRGPVLGPMVVAAVMLDDDGPLRKMHVRDSKKLSPKQRERLASEIEKVATVELAIIPAEDIDEMRRHMSLNEFEARVFASLIDRLKPDKAYVDAADVNEERFQDMIRSGLSCSPDLFCCHRADDIYPVVSAASIIAKTQRDRLIADIQKEIKQPIGSGYASDPVTTAFLEKWLKENKDYPPHTRKSWATAKKALMLAKNSKLTDWSDKE
ncbi:MAG: ribonuclease HII [Methanomassiliicoccales archaeon]|nr:ribonuclease HII [Methanomassiliicoccales archaeon]